MCLSACWAYNSVNEPWKITQAVITAPIQFFIVFPNFDCNGSAKINAKVAIYVQNKFWRQEY
jgi:hypothetical protein